MEIGIYIPYFSIEEKDDWWDIVITYIPQLNNTPIEDNYADISLK